MTLGGLLLLDADRDLGATPVANNSTADLAPDALAVITIGAVIRV